MENTPSGRDIYLRDNATKTAEDPESFWKKQSALAQQRLSDPALYKVAFAEMKKAINQAARVLPETARNVA